MIPPSYRRRPLFRTGLTAAFFLAVIPPPFARSDFTNAESGDTENHLNKIPRNLPPPEAVDDPYITKADRLYNETTLLQRGTEKFWWNQWEDIALLMFVAGLLGFVAYRIRGRCRLRE